MEKKNVYKIVGAGTLLLALGVWVYETFKKEKKQIANDQKKIVDEIVEVGGDPEKVVEQVVESVEESDRNFTKALFVSLNSPGSGFNTDFIDTDKVLPQENIIHVTEDVAGDKRFLKLLFEIPNYSQEVGNYNKITFKIITRAIQDAGKYIMTKIFKLGERPAWSSTVVVLSYSYLYQETPESPIIEKYRYFEIPKKILEKAYPGGEYDSMRPRSERFYQDMNTPEGRSYLDQVVGNDITRMINRDAQRKAEADCDNLVMTENSLRLKDVLLMHSIGFPLEEDGERLISLSQAADALEFLVDNDSDESKRWFVIERRGQKGDISNAVLDSFRYKGILFHAPNKDGKFDSLSRHYCMTGFNTVGTCNIAAVFDQEEAKREEEERLEKAAAEARKKEAEMAPASREALEAMAAALGTSVEKKKNDKKIGWS